MIDKTDSKYKHIENIFDTNDRKKSYNNIYGNYFIHYKDKSKNELISILKRRCERFMNLLNSNAEILLFIVIIVMFGVMHIIIEKILDDKQDEYYKLLEKNV